MTQEEPLSLCAVDPALMTIVMTKIRYILSLDTILLHELRNSIN